jgi:hypothetical protein
MTTTEEDAMSPQDPTRPHRGHPPFDPTALVLGLVFAAVAVVGLLDPELTRRIDLGVLVPVTLLTVGGALLLGSAFVRGRDDG